MLPAGWAEHADPNTGKKFYHNAGTGETSWELPKAAVTALPAGWSEHVDPNSGKTFFHNASTGQTAWERPQEVAQPAAAQPQVAAQAAEVATLPPGWTEHADPGSGKTFYYNATTGVTSWEKPAAAQQPAAAAQQPAAAAQPAAAVPGGAGADEPLRSITAYLDEAKAVQVQLKSAEDGVLGALLTEHAAALKQNAEHTFAAVSAAASELLPKAQEKAALSGHALDALNTAIQAFEMRYGVPKSETIPVTLLLAKDKPTSRNYPSLVQQVETLCSRTLPELEERESAAFKAQLLRGGVHPALDTQLAELQTWLKQSMQALRERYGPILSQSDHLPVYKKVGAGPTELSILTWNVMEFPKASQKEGEDRVLEGLLPFCDLVVKELNRADDRQLLLDALSSDQVIAQHGQLVLHTIRDAFEAKGVDAVLLQEICSEVMDQIKDLCVGKRWHHCFSSGDGNSTKCDAITCVISKDDFQEEEGGGVEIQEAKTVRHFAAARRSSTWLVSCHVPVSNEARESVKQEGGVRVVQKLVQELHGKGKALIVGGDWNTDIRGVKSKVSANIPYGCSSCNAHTDEKTCFGATVPVDGLLEII